MATGPSSASTSPSAPQAGVCGTASDRASLACLGGRLGPSGLPRSALATRGVAWREPPLSLLELLAGRSRLASVRPPLAAGTDAIPVLILPSGSIMYRRSSRSRPHCLPPRSAVCAADGPWAKTRAAARSEGCGSSVPTPRPCGSRTSGRRSCVALRIAAMPACRYDVPRLDGMSLRAALDARHGNSQWLAAISSSSGWRARETSAATCGSTVLSSGKRRVGAQRLASPGRHRPQPIVQTPGAARPRPVYDALSRPIPRLLLHARCSEKRWRRLVAVRRPGPLASLVARLL